MNFTFNCLTIEFSNNKFLINYFNILLQHTFKVLLYTIVQV